MFTKKRHEFLFELKDNEEISSLMGMSADELNEISIDVFELIREKVLQVSYKYANSLIITGGSGLGKTHEVKEALKESRERYKFVKGDITTAGLYQLLFEHKDELIVFDDCDAVFEDADPNILKAALDSYPEREVSRSIASYFSTKGMSMKDIMANYLGDIQMAENKHLFKASNKGKMPRTFIFTGRVIFISNKKLKDIDPNLITRATATIDVDLTHQEVLERLDKVISNMRKEVPIEWKDQVLKLVDYLTMNFETRNPLNIRSVLNAIDTRVSNDKRYKTINGKRFPLWQIMIKEDLVGKKAKRRPKD
jgi:hypothetical protein